MRNVYRNMRTLYKWLLDNLLTLTGTSTFQNKTLDNTNIINAASLLAGIESGINTSGGDVTLSATQKIKNVLVVSTGHAANAIVAPAENRVYLVINGDAANAVLIKKAGGTAVTIPAGKAALVAYNGTQYVAVADNQVTLAGAETLTSKTLTSPSITQKTVSHDYAGAAADWTLSATERLSQIIVATNANGACNAILTATTPNFYLVYNNTGYVLTVKNAAGTTIAIPNGKHAFVYDDGTNIVQCIDSLLSPRLVTPLIDDGDTGLSITSANQTHAAPTATIPDIGDAADEFVMKDTTQTLTLKTLTAPVINAALYGSLAEVSKDIGAGHADITLDATERKAEVIKIIGAGDAGFNLILNVDTKKMYLIDNQSGQACTVKNAAGTTIAVATTKRAIVWNDGTNIVRITADA